MHMYFSLCLHFDMPHCKKVLHLTSKALSAWISHFLSMSIRVFLEHLSFPLQFKNMHVSVDWRLWTTPGVSVRVNSHQWSVQCVSPAFIIAEHTVQQIPATLLVHKAERLTYGYVVIGFLTTSSHKRITELLILFYNSRWQTWLKSQDCAVVSYHNAASEEIIQFQEVLNIANLSIKHTQMWNDTMAKKTNGWW